MKPPTSLQIQDVLAHSLNEKNLHTAIVNLVYRICELYNAIVNFNQHFLWRTLGKLRYIFNVKY